MSEKAPIAPCPACKRSVHWCTTCSEWVRGKVDEETGLLLCELCDGPAETDYTAVHNIDERQP